MDTRLVSYAFLLLLLVSLSENSVAAEKHALVIGNSSYSESPLANPVNDASDMAEELRRLGYDLFRSGPLLDLTLEEFEFELDEFASSLHKDSIALIYYAGHGIGDGNDNFLIPIDSRIGSRFELRRRAVSIHTVQELLRYHNPSGVNILLLDACRDNPYGRSFRGGAVGLTRIGSAALEPGMFIGYAADEGQVAADGSDRNGVYTGELLSSLRKDPNRRIEVIHTEVSGQVFEKTRDQGKKQYPVFDSKLKSSVCFGKCDDEEEYFANITVQPEPADAFVRILNISEPYEPGMKLKAGQEYEIRVEKTGYKKWQNKIILRQGSQIVPARLEKKMPTWKKALYTLLGVVVVGAIYDATQTDPAEVDTVGATLTIPLIQ